jgi:hypothetical protein
LFDNDGIDNRNSSSWDEVDQETLRIDLEQRFQIVEKIRESLINEEANRRMMSSLSLSDEDEAACFDEVGQRQRVID